MNDFDRGLLLGVLIGEGHFGGDGRQPHVTVRMHTRHKPLFDWMAKMVPGSKVYGPYRHGGRDYCQWMARGQALQALVALLDASPFEAIDPVVFGKYQDMKEAYGIGSP